MQEYILRLIQIRRVRNGKRFSQVYEFTSYVVPMIGDIILLGEYKTFLVESRAFYAYDNTKVDIYGRIL